MDIGDKTIKNTVASKIGFDTRPNTKPILFQILFGLKRNLGRIQEITKRSTPKIVVIAANKTSLRENIITESPKKIMLQVKPKIRSMRHCVNFIPPDTVYLMHVVALGRGLATILRQHVGKIA